ncbi:TetR/AcrR family transcriptional regulator [Bacillus sp. NTK071]|uniref:TetR/AcrR family transcriptional regulator n=2 Tax=Bacilli TaxID=91061 RepID=A0A4U1MHZ3_9BACL|nr:MULTISPECIES: TetR/AcrR family transcriptional regulator [Bacillaceae]MBN8208227.1 TetR/AcrR family transcriptional regulator [Bacillus sp. NTK071]TKD70397.1 TetR/AcrR family transcriptional regulator [Pseudalkalibacillus hwajinpoensis]
MNNSKTDSLLNGGETGELTDKQKRIVEAAIEMFSEKGFAASSTSEIARRAGVAEGTIFRHYKTKKELLLAIVTPVMGNLVAPFIVKDLNKVLEKNYEFYEEFLEAMVRNRRTFIQKHLPIVRILVQEIPFHEELRAQFIEHVARDIYTRFENIVRHFQEKGELVQMPPSSVVRLTISSIMGFFLARYIFLPDHEWNEEEEIEMTIQFIMNGVKAR